MSILEEYVDVRLSPMNITHYEALGYSIPRRMVRGKMKVSRGTEICIKVSDLPLGSNVKLTKVCDICGKHVREQAYSSILRNRDNDGADRCRPCGARAKELRKAESGHNLADINPEVAALWHPTLNEALPSEVAPRSGMRAWWLCGEEGCGHIWESEIKGVTNGSRCPVCNMSKGERKIRSYLRFLGYGFIHGKDYEGLTGLGGGLLSYDFVVSYQDGDCALLVEYDGEQHEIAVDHFGGERKLKRQREHDRRKDEYARLHRIPLLRIKHTEFDDIERKINVALASVIRGNNIAC